MIPNEKTIIPRKDNTSVVMTLTGFVNVGQEYRVERIEGGKILISPVKRRNKI